MLKSFDIAEREPTARDKNTGPEGPFCRFEKLRPKRGYFPSFRCHSGYFFSTLPPHVPYHE